jgi:uncharacterized protein (DUF4415 family)
MASEPVIEEDLDQVPELGPEWFAKARRARDVGVPRAASKSKGGRPKSVDPKVLVSLRLSARVVAHFKGENPEGWQRRLKAVLEAAVDAET